MPILGQISETFSMEESSMSGEDDFFSVAITMPLVAGRRSGGGGGGGSRSEVVV